MLISPGQWFKSTSINTVKELMIRERDGRVLGYARCKSLPVHLHKINERRGRCMNAEAIMLIDSLGAYFCGQTLQKRQEDAE